MTAADVNEDMRKIIDAIPCFMVNDVRRSDCIRSVNNRITDAKQSSIDNALS